VDTLSRRPQVKRGSLGSSTSPRMPKKRADAVIAYPTIPMIVASVATTESMIILSLGDGRKAHYTYPPDGRFHITPEEGTSNRSFFEPGPAYTDLNYYPMALVPVPVDQSGLRRPYHTSSAQSMTIPAPTSRDGRLEIGILGQQATREILESLGSQGARVALFQGPRSDTTIVFRHLS